MYSMKKGDRILLAIFAVLLVAAFFAYVYARLAPVPAERTATVSVDGQIVDILYLDEIIEPYRRVYKSAAGYNTVYADREGVTVVEADCPDQHCVRAGRISRRGASSVCLPHRFILRISGRDNNELDGGTY